MLKSPCLQLSSTCPSTIKKIVQMIMMMINIIINLIIIIIIVIAIIVIIVQIVTIILILIIHLLLLTMVLMVKACLPIVPQVNSGSINLQLATNHLRLRWSTYLCLIFSHLEHTNKCNAFCFKKCSLSCLQFVVIQLIFVFYSKLILVLFMHSLHWIPISKRRISLWSENL